MLGSAYREWKHAPHPGFTASQLIVAWHWATKTHTKLSQLSPAVSCSLLSAGDLGVLLGCLALESHGSLVHTHPLPLSPRCQMASS